MTGEAAVREIAERRQRGLQMGGEERIGRQHAAGLYTVRERIGRLLDRGSFREAGVLAGEIEKNPAGEIISYLPSGCVAGTGTVDGRLVCVGGADFTARGRFGRGGRATRSKEAFLDDTAAHYRCPLVPFFDSAGADARGMETSGYMYLPYVDWSQVGKLLGAVPVVSVVGGVAGGDPAGRAIPAHWILMANGTGQMFASGPPVVARSIGEKVTREELGGSSLHFHVSSVADNEDDALAQVRRFLGYLPRNVWELPPQLPSDDPVGRRAEALLSSVHRNRRRPCDMRQVVRLVFDRDSLFEIKPSFGLSLIATFARLGGHVVGLVANSPMYLSGLSATQRLTKRPTSSTSVTRTTSRSSTSPMCPASWSARPRKETARCVAYARADGAGPGHSPPGIVLVRKAYGMGANAMGNPASVSIRLAWPLEEWSSIPIEGGIDADYKRETENAPEPAAKRAELEERLLGLQGPRRGRESVRSQAAGDRRNYSRGEMRWRTDRWTQGSRRHGQTRSRRWSCAATSRAGWVGRNVSSASIPKAS
jgi:acetyl-CoA carboxylase carboxyltransferase component